MNEAFVSPPLRVDLSPHGRPMQRADIEFHGVDMSGQSFEARVFLNNPTAGARTLPTAENGYAGSFHVYGLGLSRGSGRSHPSDRTITATDAVRRAAAAGPHVTVTVVPVDYNEPARSAAEAFSVQDISIVTS